MNAAFDQLGPDAASPLLVEVPHAATLLEPEAASHMTTPAFCVAHDADLYVDELFAGAVEAGATLLRARYSRHVCDLNTAPEACVINAGDSLVLHTAANGRRARLEPIPASEVERRTRTMFTPYHARIEALLAAKHARFGVAVMVAAHSHAPPPGGARSPAVVVGSRSGSSCHPSVAGLVMRAAEEEGWSASADVPFEGGYALQRWGRPEQGWHAVQIELRRDLYLNSATLERGEEFERVVAWATKLAAALVEASPRDRDAARSRGESAAKP